jgi:acyl-CoA synthetase (NDP forming)
VQRDLLAVVRAAGMRLIGPNCLGVANTDPAVRLNATFAPGLPARGRVGFFCQSGVLGVALLAEADRRGLGLSSFVSAGNRADVSGNDLLQFWQDDPATDVVLLYLETFGNPRKFARLARRLGREKPLVAVAHVPAAPDGDAGPWPDTAALLRHSGVIRVDTVAELFDVGVLLAGQPLPAGTRVGIVTNSSALGVLATGACAAAGLAVTIESDVGVQADPPLFGAALHAALADPEVDAVVVACAPPLPGSEEAAGYGAAIASVAGSGAGKPVVATLLAGTRPAGVPAYPSVEEAVRALSRVARYAHWRREPPGRVPELSTVDDDDPLVRYGIPVVPSIAATDTDSAVAAARALGFPVALKVADPRLRHRIDLGAVRLDLPDDAAVRAAYAELARLSQTGGWTGVGRRVMVQPMVAPGVSVVVEAVQDPRFGPVVGFGPGGVTGELLDDRAWRPAPLTDRDAAALVREPRSAALLFGHRGARPVAVADLEDLLLRVGRLVDDQPEVRRLSLNPVLVRPDGLSVLHAAVHYGPDVDRPDTGPRRL